MKEKTRPGDGRESPAPESRAEDILKIRYVIRPFDVETMSRHTRDVYELYPDGKVTYSLYEKGERKPRRKTETHTASGEDYRALCRELNACIASADRQNWYEDDCSAEVTLYRPFCRADTMDRGYGGEAEDVGQITERYIFAAAEKR